MSKSGAYAQERQDVVMLGLQNLPQQRNPVIGEEDPGTSKL